jgi:phosphomevalonate kinase
LKIKAIAPGKLILLGEYAVLEGAPALVMAVNRFAKVTLQTNSSRFNTIRAPAIGISDLPFTLNENGKISFNDSIPGEEKEKLRFFLSTFEYAAQFYKQNFNKLPSFTITLNTSQFFNKDDSQKLGLGSSAALTLALITTLIHFSNPEIKIEKEIDAIFKTTLQAHRQAQGNIGSGIDIAASIFGGILQYQIIDKEFLKIPFYEKLTIPTDLYILIIWTGISASTKQFVRNIEIFKRKNLADFENLMKRMTKISLTGIEALKQKNTPEFMDAVGEYYSAMKELGEKSGTPIVSKSHQEIFNLVATAGGVYKPSGAGGGDLGIAFCNSLKTKDAIFKKIKNTTFKIINLNVAKKGIQLITQ